MKLLRTVWDKMRRTMEVSPEQARSWGVPAPYASTEDMVAAVDRAKQTAREAEHQAQDIVAALMEDATVPVAKLSRILGLSRPTLYTYKRESDARKALETPYTRRTKEELAEAIAASADGSSDEPLFELNGVEYSLGKGKKMTAAQREQLDEIKRSKRDVAHDNR